ncbi:MAG: hypothetical protein U0Y68_23905 [Blastocatellia bacterium]
MNCQHPHTWDINGSLYCQRCYRRIHKYNGLAILFGLLLLAIFAGTCFEIT